MTDCGTTAVRLAKGGQSSKEGVPMGYQSMIKIKINCLHLYFLCFFTDRVPEPPSFVTLTPW